MKKRINLDISESLWRKVGVKAAECGITKRDLVEKALEDYIGKNQKEADKMIPTKFVPSEAKKES